MSVKRLNDSMSRARPESSHQCLQQTATTNMPFRADRRRGKLNQRRQRSGERDPRQCPRSRCLVRDTLCGKSIRRRRCRTKERKFNLGFGPVDECRFTGEEWHRTCRQARSSRGRRHRPHRRRTSANGEHGRRTLDWLRVLRASTGLRASDRTTTSLLSTADTATRTSITQNPTQWA